MIQFDTFLAVTVTFCITVCGARKEYLSASGGAVADEGYFSMIKTTSLLGKFVLDW
jgi:hypothetical protein